MRLQRRAWVFFSRERDRSQEVNVEGPRRILQGRMSASSSWDAIDKYFFEEESGTNTGMVVEARPGGELVLVDKQAASETAIGHAAQGRMAAINPTATKEEIAAIKKIDPDNVENWTPVDIESIHGLQFRFHSRLQNPGYFTFLALKIGDREWRIAPIHPDIEDLMGHPHHMVECSIGGHKIPVICGPGGRPATSLREARDFAYKWSARIEGLLSSKKPRQSQ